MSTAVLEFLNPVFHEGRNLTVRRGTKWAGVKWAAINDGTHRQVNFVEVRVIEFQHIPSGWLEEEHDPRCRTKFGLTRCMKETYKGFDVREIVTMIWFEFPAPKLQPGDEVFDEALAQAAGGGE